MQTGPGPNRQNAKSEGKMRKKGKDPNQHNLYIFYNYKNGYEGYQLNRTTSNSVLVVLENYMFLKHQFF